MTLEIFTNPYDLEIVIGEHVKDKTKYVVMITRGPEHRAKLLMTAELIGNKADAIKLVEELLLGFIKKGNDLVFKVSSTSDAVPSVEDFLKGATNPLNVSQDDPRVMNILTLQMVRQIKKELEKSGASSTYTWLKLLNKDDKYALVLTDWDTILEEVEGKEATIAMIKRNKSRLTERHVGVFVQQVEENFSKVSS